MWDLIRKNECIVLATDLDGDRLTDLLADASDPLREFGNIILKKSVMKKEWIHCGMTLVILLEMVET